MIVTGQHVQRPQLDVFEVAALQNALFVRVRDAMCGSCESSQQQQGDGNNVFHFL
ncbi:hypothetical protein SDC9_184302 [bioreactor metagenome]|uniref:Uncharacterized protein n=1 Tax=bioreactor metagenome TaxID=1076179 RepID=A0A645HCN6_9ZZZZ